jgi:coenzyme F420-0:L-glutamate ligase / coenzyme F420-1:gamma-L-glutamate ligase
MAVSKLTLTALPGIPLVRAGDDLANLLIRAIRRMPMELQNKDVVVVAQKVVSKAEGRQVDLKTIEPSEQTIRLAAEVNKDPRLVEVILSESQHIVRKRRDVLIVVHRLGFTMANAGVDQSNVEGAESDHVLLLPEDPDASALALKERLDAEFGVQVGVLINDSFGRPWRVGVVGVALGAAGVPVIRNMIGTPDLFGRKLRVTEIAVADEIASAASLVMGQAREGQPAVHVRGFNWDEAAAPASAILRPKETDLFR